MFVPARHLGRASGAAALGDSAAQMLSPALGGVLLGAVGLQGVVLVELLGVAVALAALAASSFPAMPRHAATRGFSSLGREAAAGWVYIARQRGLLGLLGLSCILNGAVSFLEVLSAPIVLAVASSAVLGTVRSVAGAGMVAGSITMAAWGGPKDRVLGMLLFQVLLGIQLILMGTTTVPWILGLTGFCGLFCIPVVNGCGQAIWQTKVDPPLQGRVFALRRLTGFFRPLGYLVAGVVADRLLEPCMRGAAGDGALGFVVGSGPGRGSALLLVLMGGLTILLTLLAFRYRPLREVQRALPDVAFASTVES
jgi:hypothetical protein